MEEDRSFCAFDVTMWPTRIWNEGTSGVVFDLRCAYQCWQQEDEQVKLAFDNLVEWIGVLEGGQESHRSLHEFGEVPAEYIPDAAHDGIRSRHPALQTARPSLHRCSPDGHLREGSPASRRSARNSTHFAMTTLSHLWTRGI
ncbi:hypothetical protein TcYC6_0040960 [Trypanosoma cruzi]|nr:hypothetical protein TcYC6_0040960 [Trypanosoma cruzi]